MHCMHVKLARKAMHSWGKGGEFLGRAKSNRQQDICMLIFPTNSFSCSIFLFRLPKGFYDTCVSRRGNGIMLLAIFAPT